MPYSDEVKQLAYKLDPKAWESYSGKPKSEKQAIELHRQRSLEQAEAQMQALVQMKEVSTDISFLIPGFIRAMNEIGEYGFGLYGPLPRHREDHRVPARAASNSIAGHAAVHFGYYLCGVPHDHFNTRRHQLAAVAFNAMMEYYFAGLDEEQ